MSLTTSHEIANPAVRIVNGVELRLPAPTRSTPATARSVSPSAT